MRGIIATVFVVLVIAAFATAYPTISTGKKEVAAKKTSAASKRGGDAVVEEQGQGPHLVFREPRNFRFAAPNNEVLNIGGKRRSPYWQQYRSFPPRGRDDEDEEEDDTEDSGEEGDEDDVQDDEEEGFDTPSWDYLFPPEESNAAEYTGKNQRSNSPRRRNNRPGSGPPPPRRKYVEEPTYILAEGSHGGPSREGQQFREVGRSGGVSNREWAPRWNWKKQSRQERPDPRSRKAYPEPPPWYKIEEEGPPFRYTWNWSPRPTSVQHKFVPSNNRRNWYQGQGQVKSGYKNSWNEEKEGPRQQPQGPRRIQNWSKKHYGAPSSQKWGYY